MAKNKDDLSIKSSSEYRIRYALANGYKGREKGPDQIGVKISFKGGF